MAKQAGSAYDGTLLQIKRTKLDTASSKVVDEGKLEYGEFLFVQKATTTDGKPVGQNLLIIGDGNTNSADLQAFGSSPQNVIGKQLYYTNRTTNNRLQLIDAYNKNVYLQTRTFTKQDATGTLDPVTGNKVEVKTLGPWYEVDENGITEKEISDPSKFPRAQRIVISEMTDDVIPYISLFITPSMRVDTNATKNAQKAFGCITDVESKTGEIIIYCNNKIPVTNCYINIYGG